MVGMPRKFAAILGTTDANSPSTHVEFLPGRRGWAIPARRSRLFPERASPGIAADPVPRRQSSTWSSSSRRTSRSTIISRPIRSRSTRKANRPSAPADDTPSVNGLGTLIDGQPEGVLLTHNPNAANAGKRRPTRSTLSASPARKRRPVTRTTTTATSKKLSTKG